MCRWFPEQKTNGTVSYIFVSSIANVFCVSQRIWLCIYGITLRVSLYDVKIAWIERRLASPHLLFLFKEIVSARWEHFRGRIHRLKSFVQERYRTGEQNASRSGTLRREQSPALPQKFNFVRRERSVPVSEFTANPAAGAKFSEFGHPFVCFADISPNRGITPPYPAKCISCVGNSLDRSVKLYQITRANTVRPYEQGTTSVLFRKITSSLAGDS